MDTIIHIPAQIVSLSFNEFKKYHEQHFRTDTMTAEQRYLFAGGKLPTKKKPSKG